MELSKSASEPFSNRAATENSTLKEPNNVTPASSSNSVPPDKAQSKKEVQSAQPSDGAITKLYIHPRLNKVNQQCLKTSPFFKEHNATTSKNIFASGVPTIASQHHHSSTSSLGAPNVSISQIQPFEKVRANNESNRSRVEADTPSTSTASSHLLSSKKVTAGDKPSTSTAKATSASRVPNVTCQNLQSPKPSATVDNSRSLAVTNLKPNGSTHSQPSPPRSQTSIKNSSSPQKAAACTTPKKRCLNGSPRKGGYRSPSKGSPSQNREIKSLKAKEGKQLQVKQLDELVKLVKIVETNRHLR